MAVYQKVLVVAMVFAALVAANQAAEYCDNEYEYLCKGDTVCCCKSMSAEGPCIGFGCCPKAMNVCCKDSNKCCSEEFPVCDLKRDICRMKVAKGGLRGWEAWEMFTSTPMAERADAHQVSTSHNVNIEAVV